MKISKKITTMNKKRVRILWKKNCDKYQSFWFCRFVSGFVKKGKKEFVEGVLQKTIILLKDITKIPQVLIFEAILAVKPTLILRWIRRAKMYYNVPKMITHVKQHKFAIFMFNRYLRQAVGKKLIKLQSFLLNELLGAVGNGGESTLINFKNDIHSIAVYNRTRARFTW